MIETGMQGCALTHIPWIRTSGGPMTVRSALLRADGIAGLDGGLNGIQAGAQMRFLTAIAALVVRVQGKPAGSFDGAAVDTALALISAHGNVLDPDRPFLQSPAGSQAPGAGKDTPVKKLLPWMPADRAEDFWTDGVQPPVLAMAEAVLALAVHHHYSFGGNNRLEGRLCANGSPGIRYPGVGYTATEVLWAGANLFETILTNTPAAWVDGSGLPAWADPSCSVSGMGAGRPEHPLWRATWGSNTALCRWEDTGLTAVSTGGSPHLPPTMGAGKTGAKAWWDARNTEDTFYLYVDVEKKNAKGVVLSSERKAQRLDFGHSTTDLAVEWNSKNLSAALRSRSKGMVLGPKRGAQIMFLRHLVEGSASSPVVRRTEVLVSSPKKWLVDEDRADAVSSASLQVKAVCAEVCKPFSEKGRLTALRDRRTDVETAFWQKVARPFEHFIINGAGDSIDPAVWPAVRAAALEAFDEVASSTPVPKLAPFIMTARNRVAWNITEALGLTRSKIAAA